MDEAAYNRAASEAIGAALGGAAMGRGTRTLAIELAAGGTGVAHVWVNGSSGP